ncbi:MAG: RNA polymerase sigma factor [Planctomycetes bacterium]|jgi:RNA polymerase sigma-70 factor (ECF subfamily)|nr:RNA polymerase sigma factor [Planctomycetota bacterium]
MFENNKLSDEAIVEKVRSEDKELYAIIIERYQNKLSRYASNLIQDENNAADIVQESFIKAFINLKGFNTKKKFSSWIYRIVHNESINIAKKNKREIPILEDMDFKSEENIELALEKKEIVEKVEKCFSKIAILYAEPLRLYYIDEKSYEEISDILRLPMGTVATRINRAKIILKKICQKI